MLTFLTRRKQTVRLSAQHVHAISGIVSVAVFGVLLWMELKRPLRKSVEPKLRRNARNLAVAATAGLALRIAEQPVAGPLSALVARRRWGLLQIAKLPLWLEVSAAVLLLDYTLYWWHVATHRVPWLWRFHAVHHIDLDLLDIQTFPSSLRINFLPRMDLLKNSSWL